MPGPETPVANPETPAAKQALADANAAAENLKARQAAGSTPPAADANPETPAAKQALADAAAPRGRQAREAKAPPAPPPAEDAALETEEEPSYEQRVAAEKARVHAKTRRLMSAFTSPEVNLPHAGAALLAAHVCLTQDKPEHLGATEAIAWAKSFRQQYPIVWSALRVGHVTQLAASLRRAEVESGHLRQLDELSAVIRG